MESLNGIEDVNWVRKAGLAHSLKVQETFQGTIQGEGFLTGALSDFIRLYGCSVGCHFCDTGYARSSSEVASYYEKTVAELLGELRSPRVVVTGGEPTLNIGVWFLLDALTRKYNMVQKAVQIETAGLRWNPVLDMTWITLSPKTHLNEKAVIDPIFWGRADELKLIIVDGSEFEFYRESIEAMEPRTHIYFQPEWSVRAKAIPIIIELLKEFPRAKMSLQSHKYARLP